MPVHMQIGEVVLGVRFCPLAAYPRHLGTFQKVPGPRPSLESPCNLQTIDSDKQELWSQIAWVILPLASS